MGISLVSINAPSLSLVENLNLLPRNSKVGSLSDLTRLLRDAICSHQGSIVEHIYWGAELHKKLRMASDDHGPDSSAAISVLSKIDNCLPHIFETAWRLTVNYLIGYFSSTHKSKIVPRMCVKSTRSEGEEKYILDLFREDGGVSSITYKVSANTGFFQVEDSGIRYRCNNIPLAARENNYINPRLSTSAVKMYNHSIMTRARRFIKKEEIDKEWCRCWNDYSEESGNEASCYKSTLIVPLTLINNHQSSEFIKYTMIGASKGSRTIYGFLCFDHPTVGYFSEDDINIGYIFADLLSFYKINELNFTAFSKTYGKVSTLHRGRK